MVLEQSVKPEQDQVLVAMAALVLLMIGQEPLVIWLAVVAVVATAVNEQVMDFMVAAEVLVQPHITVIMSILMK
ncbi:MAG: hypothetical protein EBY83_08115 [Verrucomicrobia bacterium]|nr:hypothetical protein [Verrucomicrobiota bacterium]